ncbi:ORF6N domain-containing protein [Candidatus Saganbacteria bacterium]|nr:ORF6N domain-containing protein [Candidatus Saganbacteria bacterium]
MKYKLIKKLYWCPQFVETRALNQAVRRNLFRFPADFMFFLRRQEIMNLSQIVISSKMKHAPNTFVFTEQGVAMLYRCA